MIEKTKKSKSLNAVMHRGKNIKAICAFTLAEMLVVMGIIGVISALTIPNLRQGTNSQEVVAKVIKARATIDEAYGRAVATYGDPCTWSIGKTSAADQTAVWYTRITENLKTDKICELVDNTNTTCWNGLALNSNYYKVKLSDGTSLAMLASATNIMSGYGCGTSQLLTVFLDIDGPQKGMASNCKDIYAFNYGAGYMPPANNPLLSNTPDNCAGWVLTMKNADFLKSNYNDANGWKCPNGKYLNWNSNKTCN